MSTGWTIGYVIGGVIVLLVVALLLLMIRGANRAAVKAESVFAALVDVRDNTEPLWAVSDVNNAIERITDGAAAVREHLAGKSAGNSAATTTDGSGVPT
jgi:hypothetical protein